MLDRQFVVGLDLETYKFGLLNLTPRVVCMSLANEQGVSVLGGGCSKQVMDEAFDYYLNDERYHIVGQAIRFDMACMAARNPARLPAIFRAYESGRIHSVDVREKIINLTKTGKLKVAYYPDGSSRKVDYKLSSISKKYGVGTYDEGDKDGEDALRMRFEALDDVPIASWPKDAYDYAIKDAAFARSIFLRQNGGQALPVETLHTACDFCLYLISCRGFAIDPVEKEKVEAELAEKLKPENLNLLIQYGILRPAQPPRPYARGAKNHVEFCPKKNCSCPPKMTAGEPEKVSKKTLLEFVEYLAQLYPIKFNYNPPTDKNPNGTKKIDTEFFEEYAGLSPVLGQYYERQKLQKLVTTELPRMNWQGATSPVVHPSFDVLKETSRTSSFAAKKYPSANIQNVHEDARRCYIARAGFWLLSVDVSQMELGTLAQTCLRLFGFSVLAQVIRSGKDAHAFLGASLARLLDGKFIHVGDPMELYARFKELERDDPEYYDQFRGLAKPTGLGLPGGLGAATFISFAKATYGVQIVTPRGEPDIDKAKKIKEGWIKTYPEMGKYLAYINRRCQTGPKSFSYTSPLGMTRVNASYCAAANGLALQTPGAEGAKVWLYRALRSCYDYSLGSILFGNYFPNGFIHDEIIGEVVPSVAHEAAEEMKRLLSGAFSLITPDIPMGGSAALMTRWNKKAKPVYDDQGRLTLWQP